MEFKALTLSELNNNQYIEICNKIEKKGLHAGSIYFSDDIFDYCFSEIMRKVLGKRYSIYSYMELNDEEINKLYIELQHTQEALNKITSGKDFIAYMSKSRFEYRPVNFESFDDVEIKTILKQIKNINEQFILYVKKTIEHNYSLWILGL